MDLLPEHWTVGGVVVFFNICVSLHMSCIALIIFFKQVSYPEFLEKDLLVCSLWTGFDLYTNVRCNNHFSVYWCNQCWLYNVLYIVCLRRLADCHDTR